MLVCALVFLALSQTLYLIPHYAAPITGLMMGLNVQALRHMRLWKYRGGRAGAAYITGAVAVFLLGFVVYCVQSPPESPRAEMANALEKLAGKHLVLVRYGPNHAEEVGDEWVYNGADLDGPQIVWARDLGPAQNLMILEHYRDRRIWLVTVNEPEISLMPYP